MKKILAALSVLCFLIPATAYAQRGDFDQWVEGFRTEALQFGVSEDTANAALDGLEADPRVVALYNRQPEQKISFAQYRKSVVSQARIDKGRELMQRYGQELDTVSRRYGVQPQFIVALWGVETSFGQNTGNFQIVPSLATLAWEGRREAFFRNELLKALQIIDQGDVALEDMKGSWAGAMGQNQFMPSSFVRFAADGDGDGRRDIWNDRMDVFASTANYLTSNGWQPGERWGRAVRVPHGLDPDLVGTRHSLTLMQWARYGLTLPDGGDLPQDGDMRASLIAPDGLNGPAWLAYENYRVIMRWNRSTYFATSVGLLADAIAEGQ